MKAIVPRVRRPGYFEILGNARYHRALMLLFLAGCSASKLCSCKFATEVSSQSVVHGVGSSNATIAASRQLLAMHICNENFCALSVKAAGLVSIQRD